MPAGPPAGWGGGLSESRPPGPAAGAPPADRTAGLLTLIGGVLVVVGAFLPTLTETFNGQTYTQSGASAGIGVVILGGFAIVKGLSALTPRMTSMRFATPLLTAGLLALLLIFRWSSLQELIRADERSGVDASVGIGFWIEVVGTVMIGVAGTTDLAARRRA
jgi:hypothetical protein